MFGVPWPVIALVVGVVGVGSAYVKGHVDGVAHHKAVVLRQIEAANATIRDLNGQLDRAEADADALRNGATSAALAVAAKQACPVSADLAAKLNAIR